MAGHTTTGQPVKALVRPDSVGVMTVSRPDRLNAISAEVAEALGKVVEGFSVNPSVRAIVVAGEGKTFCAGADISELSALGGPAAFARFVSRLTASLDTLASCPKPSVAAVHGALSAGVWSWRSHAISGWPSPGRAWACRRSSSACCRPPRAR